MASTSLRSVLRTPPTVETYMGNVVATAMSRIFAVSLIPNQTMKRGTRERKGMVRSVWSEESSSSSPSRVKPVVMPRVSPAARPMTSPMPERVREVASASDSWPLPHNSPTASMTCGGEARTSGVRRPVAEETHQRTRRATGPRARTAREYVRERGRMELGAGPDEPGRASVHRCPLRRRDLLRRRPLRRHLHRPGDGGGGRGAHWRRHDSFSMSRRWAAMSTLFGVTFWSA